MKTKPKLKDTDSYWLGWNTTYICAGDKQSSCPECGSIYISWDAWTDAGLYLCIGCWAEVGRVKARLTDQPLEGEV